MILLYNSIDSNVADMMCLYVFFYFRWLELEEMRFIGFQ